MFWLKTKKKHIVEFEQKLFGELGDQLPQIAHAGKLSKVYGISFTRQPKGIYISREYKPKEYEEILKNHRTHFNLSGISVFNRKTRTFEELMLNFLYDTLTRIEIEEPEYFHKNYELKNIKKGKIKIENLELNNPDTEIAKKALRSLTYEQLEKFDLDGTFEIEIDEGHFYTILDMEDGNYIATTKGGKIFRLNHDHEIRVKQIANNPIEFYEIYAGDKTKLETIINE